MEIEIRLHYFSRLEWNINSSQSIKTTKGPSSFHSCLRSAFFLNRLELAGSIFFVVLLSLSFSVFLGIQSIKNTIIEKIVSRSSVFNLRVFGWFNRCLLGISFESLKVLDSWSIVNYSMVFLILSIISIIRISVY